MTEQSIHRHVLIIEDDHGRRSIALDAATYSLGRDQTNAIVLESKAVSRQHALLLRLPIPESEGYRYRLVDGNSSGRPSANGVMINGQRCSSHDLVSGDTILFGSKVKASYMMVSMGQAEFIKYLDMINFQSIKFEPVNAKETLAGVEFKPEELNRTAVDQAPSILKTDQPKPNPIDPTDRKRLTVGLAGLAGILIGMALGGLIAMASGSPNSASPNQNVNHCAQG